MKEGKYIFKAFTTSETFKYTISVVRGKRWANSNLLIETDNGLLKMDGELKQLSIAEKLQSENIYRFRIVSNNPSNIRATVTGFHYFPTQIQKIQNRLEVDFRGFEVYTIPKSKNTFISEKVYDDETRYVLERKNRERQIGNTLKKPSLVFKREFVKETSQDEEKLNKGEEFDKRTMFQDQDRKQDTYLKNMKISSDKIPNKKKPSPVSSELYSCPEYIPNSGIVIENLKADEQGWITINKSELKEYSQFAIYIADSYSSIMDHVMLKEPQNETYDLRLKENQKRDQIYIDNRFCEIAKNVGGDKKKEIQLENIGTTKFVVIEKQ